MFIKDIIKSFDKMGVLIRQKHFVSVKSIYVNPVLGLWKRIF